MLPRRYHAGATILLFIALCFDTSRVLCKVFPDDLLDCYRDLSENPVPLSTASLVTLVRKVERMENAATLDLRTLSYTLLHRFRVDGLERDPDAVGSEFVVPVRQSGRQALKWDVLAEQLLPGNSLLFPEDSLTHYEKCALHVMLSSSVDPSECFATDNASSTTTMSAGCRERGVVSDPLGAVAAGTVVAALCAGSQPLTVSLRDLLASAAAAGLAPALSGHGDATSAAAPRDREKLESLRAYSSMGNAAAVDSLWASTIAGDLSEVAVYQGPRLDSVVVGAPGVWDDALLPRNYVINHRIVIDVTDAEIRGGIDGLVLGGGLRAWLEQMGRLRLSQLLEMYYSARGIVLEAAGQLRACQRVNVLSTEGHGPRLRNETLNMARLMYLRSDGPQMTDAAIQNYTNASISTFSNYYRTLLTNDPVCSGESWSPPSAHLLVLMDSTWTKAEATRLLTWLAQQADVSELGGALSLLDGRGGRWLLNSSRRFTDIPQALRNQSLLSWTSGVDLSPSLLAVSARLREVRSAPGGPALVLLLLAYSSTLGDADMQLAAEQLRAINASFPELTLMAVTSDVTSARFQTLLGEHGHVLVAPDSRAETLVPLVVQRLTQVPGYLVPGSCDAAGAGAGGVGGMSADLELYLTPGVTTRMRVQPQYLPDGAVFSVQVQSAGYGVVRACLSSEGAASPAAASEGRAVSEGCGELSGGLLTLNATGRGRPLLLALEATSSLHKCAEDDCRFPDQVRVSIRHGGLLCPGSPRSDAAPSIASLFAVVMATLLALVLAPSQHRL